MASLAAPRLNRKYNRHQAIGRVRYGRQELQFLDVQATRLSSTRATVFTKVAKYGAITVKGAANLAAIP